MQSATPEIFNVHSATAPDWVLPIKKPVLLSFAFAVECIRLTQSLLETWKVLKSWKRYHATFYWHCRDGKHNNCLASITCLLNDLSLRTNKFRTSGLYIGFKQSPTSEFNFNFLSFKMFKLPWNSDRIVGLLEMWGYWSKQEEQAMNCNGNRQRRLAPWTLRWCERLVVNLIPSLVIAQLFALCRLWQISSLLSCLFCVLVKRVWKLWNMFAIDQFLIEVYKLKDVRLWNK